MTTAPGVGLPLRGVRRGSAFAVVLVAVLLAQFDLWAVNTAAPTIQADLHATNGAIQVVVGGYALTYGTLLIAGGRFGDSRGRAYALRWGLVLFAGASILCALAQTGMELVVARLLQGACAAIMVPQVLGLVTALFEESERRAAMSWFGVTFGLGAALGQTVGGLLVGHTANGWRAIFLVGVPVALLAHVLLGRLLPSARESRPVATDAAGLAGLSSSLLLLFLVLTLGPTHGWPWWTWTALGASALIAAVTITHERTASRAAPTTDHLILDPALFRDRTFRVSLLVNACYFLAFGGLQFALTFTLQAGLGESPLRTGLTFLPQGLGFVLGSLVAVRFATRLGPRLTTLGATASAVACLVVLVDAHLGPQALEPGRLVPAMTLLGVGNGLAIPAMIATVLAVITPRYAGTAAGLLTTTQQVCLAFGVVVFGLILSATAGHGPDLATGAASYLPALRVDLVAALGLIVAGGAASLLLPKGVVRNQGIEPSDSRDA